MMTAMEECAMYRHKRRTRPMRFKIVSMGDECVGKSCLIKRFCEKIWIPSRIPTVGVDFGTKSVCVGDEKQPLKLDFFDVAGSPEYVAVREEVYCNAQGAVLIYDSSRTETFNNLGTWLSEASENGAAGMFTMLVANKRQGAQQVDPLKARSFASQHGLGFAEVDIPSGSGVDEVFNTIINVLTRNLCKEPQSVCSHASTDAYTQVHKACNGSYWESGREDANAYTKIHNARSVAISTDQPTA